MGISQEISTLIKNRVMIRHRNNEELSGGDAVCMLCSRQMVLPPGSVCMVVDDEGLLCTVCGNRYAPDIVQLLQQEVPVIKEESATYYKKPFVGNSRFQEAESIIKKDVQRLLEVTDMLSRGVARGIIEAPAGHIGLMHYAKDIRRPAQRENETDKDYEMRLRTFRISSLYKKIYSDTTERVKRIQLFLNRHGISL